MSLRAPHLALAAGLLAGCADPLAPRAAPPEPSSVPRFAAGGTLVLRDVFEVHFTIPGGTCGLATDVEGTGTFRQMNRVQQLGPGAWRVAFNWSAHGTAVGDDGSRYRFNYSANGSYVDVVADPTALPVEIALVDHFNLLGEGRTPDLRVYLRGRFLFDGVDITPIGSPVIRGADLECDPI